MNSQMWTQLQKDEIADQAFSHLALLARKLLTASVPVLWARGQGLDAESPSHPGPRYPAEGADELNSAFKGTWKPTIDFTK